MSLFLFLLLSLLLVSALVLLVFGFSTPLTQAALIFLYLLVDKTYLGWGVFWVVLIAAIIAEAIEFFAGVKGAQRVQGSKRSAWGAILGGFVGAILFAPLVFPIGSILGSFVGTFTGAASMELTVAGKANKAMKVGTWATIGKMVGFCVKVSISIGICVGVIGWGILRMMVG